MAIDRKRVTLHPYNDDGTIDLNTNLYPKTFLDGIVDRNGEQVNVALEEEVNKKVDKVTGKGLSTNDFDNTYKDKVDTNTTKLNNVRYDSVTGSYYVQGNVNFWGDYPRTSISIDGDNDGVGGDDALVIQRDRLIGSWQGVDTTLMLPISHDNDVIRTLATQEWTSDFTNKYVNEHKLVETTWEDLVALKNNSQLIPGQLYRITNYTCTTTQAQTSSAHHDFDIIVLAIDVDKLDERASACMHLPIYRVTFMDNVTLNCYLCYTGDVSFNLINVETMLGIANIEESECDIFDLENKIITTSTYASYELTIPNLKYNYFQDSKLSAWQIWYCLDNDVSRFKWADAIGSQEITNLNSAFSDGSPLIRQPMYDNQNPSLSYHDYQYAWGTLADAEDGDPTNFIYSLNSTLINGEEVFNSCDDEPQSANVRTTSGGNGRGVIYRMIDEFNNDCPYDFKNIKFARYEITACENCPSLIGKFYGILDLDGNQILTNYMTIDTSSYRYYYTFDCCGTDYSMNAIGTTLTRPDGTTFTLDQIQCFKCSITADERDSRYFCLNNFVVALESSRDCSFKFEDWVENAMFLGGSNQFSIKSFVNSIVGCDASIIDGYVGFVGSRINNIKSSLIICTTINKAIFYRSNVNAIDSSCIVSLDHTFTMSDIDIIALSTIISNTESCFVYSKLHYMGYCDLKSEKTTIMRSNILAMVQCHISVSEYVINRSIINVMQFCDCDSSKGIRTYIDQSICNHLGDISVTNTTEGNFFILNSHIIGCDNCSLKLIKACNITVLQNSTLGEIEGCNFKDNKGLTCSQDLVGCNFESDVNYLTISSTNTSQTITNTNIHDVCGTENNVKNLVISEDYSTIHTVDIYGPGHSTIEIS